eukprot:4201587-Pleurochrysis_carterae.AAC.3
MADSEQVAFGQRTRLRATSCPRTGFALAPRPRNLLPSMCAPPAASSSSASQLALCPRLRRRRSLSTSRSTLPT